MFIQSVVKPQIKPYKTTDAYAQRLGTINKRKYYFCWVMGLWVFRIVFQICLHVSILLFPLTRKKDH